MFKWHSDRINPNSGNVLAVKDKHDVWHVSSLSIDLLEYMA